MKPLVLLACLCLLGSTLAQAKKPLPPFDFLDPQALVDVGNLLSPPPANDSSEGRDDLALYTSTHANATPAELKQAKADEESDNVWDFAEVLGSSFTPDKLPKTAALFTALTGDTKEAVKVAKNTFQRPSPPHWTADDDDPKDKKHYSYPSGHTTRAFVWANLLADLFPDKRDALLAKAGRMGWERVLLGKHYPADVKAGTIFGTYLARQFLDSPKFRSEWKEVREEITAHSLTAQK